MSHLDLSSLTLPLEPTCCRPVMIECLKLMNPGYRSAKEEETSSYTTQEAKEWYLKQDEFDEVWKNGEKRLKYQFVYHHSVSSFQLHLCFIPLFSTLLIESKLADESKRVEDISLPQVRIADCRKVIPVPTHLNNASFTVSDSAPILESLLSTWRTSLHTALIRLQSASIEEEILMDFMVFTFSQTEAFQIVDDKVIPEKPSADRVPTPTETDLESAIFSPSVLQFSSESSLTLRNAFVRLVHVILLYEGFRSVDIERLNSDVGVMGELTPSSSSLLSFLPSNWSTFTSQQSCYTLYYQHLSLIASRPRHYIEIKLLHMVDDIFVLHGCLTDDSRQTNVPNEAEDLKIDNTDRVVETPTIYTVKLNSSNYVSLSSLASYSHDPSHLHHHLTSLLSLLRNRMLKHMLGDNYRVRLDRQRLNGTEMIDEEKHSQSERLIEMPHEISIAILHYLNSRELLKVGSTCWSLYYLSSEPILWRQLCQRELPIQTESTGGPSSKSSARLKHDWKNEYLARLQMQTKKSDLPSSSSSILSILGPPHFRDHWIRFPYSTPFRSMRFPFNNPFPQAYHPTPFSVHPDAPFFTLPGLGPGRFY